MTVALTIDGTPRTLRPGWRISEFLNERNTMTFSAQSLDAAWRPSGREVVTFTIDSVLMFGGNIHHTLEAGLGGSSGSDAIETAIGATDFNALPDRRQVEITLPAGTLKSMLEVLEPYLSVYGVTLDVSQVAGPTISEPLVFELSSLTSLLHNLSVVSGYAWEIDYNLVLRMFEPGVTAAPFDIEDGDGYVIGDLRVSPSLADYANRIIVKFAEEARAAYAFLVMTGNFADGDDVTVGGKTYVFDASLDNGTANHIQIGGDADASLSNLINAIVRGGTPGTDYSDPTTVNTSVTAYVQAASMMGARALAPGVAGNSIACTETADNARWITEGGGEVTTLQFGADEATTNSVVAENVAAQDGGANLVERTVVRADIRDYNTAQAVADGLLVRALVEPREITYRTHTPGLHPGMQQYIDCPKRNVDGACLITAVEISANGDILHFDVTATEGLVLVPTHQEKWRELGGASLGGGGFVTSIDSGGGGGTTTALAGPAFLGGSDGDSVLMAGTPAALDVPHVLPFFARSTFTGLIRAWVWNRESGPEARAELWNITDTALVAHSSFVSDTSRPSLPQEFYAAIVSGKQYRLRVKSDTGDSGVYGIGSLEAA